MHTFPVLDDTFLGGTAASIGDIFINIWNNIVLFLPRLVGALIILIIGYFVARLVREVLVRALRAIKFDQIVERGGVKRALASTGTNLDAAAVLAAIAFWFVFLYFIGPAVDELGIPSLTLLVASLLAYIPNVFVAVLLLVLGALAASVVAGIVRGAAGGAGLSSANLLGTVAQGAILLLVVVAALGQLHIAEYAVNTLFTAIVAMLAIAGGIAFGLGGVDSARGFLVSQSMGRMLQPGQRVQIGQQSGTVVRHDMNVTVINTDKGQVTIPNTALTRDQVTIQG